MQCEADEPTVIALVTTLGNLCTIHEVIFHDSFVLKSSLDFLFKNSFDCNVPEKQKGEATKSLLKMARIHRHNII